MLNKPLFADFVALSPQETMDRNRPCWCMSGKKWKKCHRNRETKSRLPESALHAEWYKQAELALCMHPDAPKGCSVGAIRAHTVQRATALKSISEQNHVLSGRDNRPGKTSEFRLERIGINSASTFKGFCSLHDNHSFREIDNLKELSDWTIFLLGYRALAYELYMKMVSLPTIEFYRDHLDSGMPFQRQAAIQQYLNGNIYTTKIVIDDMLV